MPFLARRRGIHTTIIAFMKSRAFLGAHGGGYTSTPTQMASPVTGDVVIAAGRRCINAYV